MDTGFLVDSITDVINDWKQEMLRRGAPIASEVKWSEVGHFRRVPLACNLESSGVKFQDMVRAMYKREVDEVAFLAAWDACVDDLVGKAVTVTSSRVVSHFRDLYPKFNFTLIEHAYYPCVQFMYLVGMCDGYKLKLTKETCTITTPSGKCVGIDRLALISSTKAKRTRRRSGDLRIALEAWRGRVRYIPKKRQVIGAYRVLRNSLPELIVEIDALFSIAVECGVETEISIYRDLDVFMQAERKKETKLEPIDAINEARRVIDVSERNPLRTLASLITPLIGSKTFLKLFGNPYQRLSMDYPPHKRDRFITGLNVVESMFDNRVQSEAHDETYKLISQFFGV